MESGELKASFDHEPALRQFVLVDRTRLEVRGGDRAKFLHNLCTNDVKSLAAGQGCEAFFTNVQGKLLGHAFLFATSDAIVIDTVPRQGPSLVTHLERYHIREDVVISDCSDEWSQVWLLGAEAAALVGRLASPADAMRLPTDRLAHTELSLARVSATVAKVGWGDGLWLSCRADEVDRLSEALSSAGAQPYGMDDLEAARLEAGFPEYGRDISDKNLPQEVDRDALAISFKKGCYLGQETVARIDALGHVNRLLRRVLFKAPSATPEGVELFSHGKPVGIVSSAAPSNHFAGTIALAMLRREATATGQTLTSSLGDGLVLGRA